MALRNFFILIIATGFVFPFTKSDSGNPEPELDSTNSVSQAKAILADAQHQNIAQKEWECLKTTYQVNTASLDIYTSSSECLVAKTAESIKSARNSNYDKVVGVLWSASECPEAEKVFGDAFEYLQNQQVDVDEIWILVGGFMWKQDTAENVKYIQSLVDEAKKRNRPIGIRTNEGTWKVVTGDTKQFSDIPLWYVNAGAPFTSFGGWETAAIENTNKGPVQCQGKKYFDLNEIN